MARDASVQIGDRVVSTAIPGVFRVLRRRRRLLDIESDRGLRMTVHEAQVRRLDGAVPVPSDT